MSDEQRLDAVLTALRNTPEPPVACPLHAPVFAALEDPEVPLENAHLDTIADSLDCDACADLLDRHPFLDAALLDLPLPPPAVPAPPARRALRPTRRVWFAALALAAALLLVALATWPDPAPVRPGPTALGPTEKGHPAYAFVQLTGPRAEGHASYAWVPRPESAERYRFEPPTEQEPGRMAANYDYTPWAWR